ncbi:MAG: ferritin family protein [Geobacteraceae bacterium]|nr:ferritin family protein [Geobacteraceae bacterium]
MDVLDSAVKHEKEAVKIYEYLADEASLPSLKRLFSSLMKDEQKHLERIANFRDTLDVARYRHDGNEFSRLFPPIVMDRGIEGLCKDEVSFYREVMEFEKKGINQYESFLSDATDEKSKQLLAGIISQEKMHYDIVKGLCVFISEQQGSR